MRSWALGMAEASWREKRAWDEDVVEADADQRGAGEGGEAIERVVWRTASPCVEEAGEGERIGLASAVWMTPSTNSGRSRYVSGANSHSDDGAHPLLGRGLGANAPPGSP